MTGIGELTRSAVTAAKSTSGTAQTVDAPVPFASMMRTMMSESADLEQQAQKAVTGMLDGSGVELHQAMIATQKADMSFELALQVRNKAVAAYQQMMTMQF